MVAAMLMLTLSLNTEAPVVILIGANLNSFALKL